MKKEDNLKKIWKLFPTYNKGVIFGALMVFVGWLLSKFFYIVGFIIMTLGMVFLMMVFFRWYSLSKKDKMKKQENKKFPSYLKKIIIGVSMMIGGGILAILLLSFNLQVSADKLINILAKIGVILGFGSMIVGGIYLSIIFRRLIFYHTDK